MRSPHAGRWQKFQPEFFPKNFSCTARRVALILNHMVKCSPRLLNRTFAALADPTRRRILEHLAHGDHCVTDLARPYSMSLPAVSKHLRILENAGLVSRRRRGRVHSLKLEAKPMKEAQQWIEEYRKFWEESFERLDEYLKQLQTKEKK
jgi:DNA-binding transcriptional ArsR family regulator